MLVIAMSTLALQNAGGHYSTNPNFVHDFFGKILHNDHIIRLWIKFDSRKMGGMKNDP